MDQYRFIITVLKNCFGLLVDCIPTSIIYEFCSRLAPYNVALSRKLVTIKSRGKTCTARVTRVLCTCGLTLPSLRDLHCPDLNRVSLLRKISMSQRRVGKPLFRAHRQKACHPGGILHSRGFVYCRLSSGYCSSWHSMAGRQIVSNIYLTGWSFFCPNILFAKGGDSSISELQRDKDLGKDLALVEPGKVEQSLPAFLALHS